MNDNSKEAFVYKWINKKDGSIYVGYHKGSTEDGYISSSKSDRFWKDYYNGDLIRDIVSYGTTKDMFLLEQKILSEMDLNSPTVYNNGRGGVIYIEEVRLKLSISAKNQTDEKKKKISNSIRKYRLGKTHSEETKKKISSKLEGHKTSDETKEKISKTSSGRRHSDETKLKLSELGKKRKHSEETKKKISDSRKQNR